MLPPPSDHLGDRRKSSSRQRHEESRHRQNKGSEQAQFRERAGPISFGYYGPPVGARRDVHDQYEE
eukprot:53979-Eustigmatos_ZCMA.PRE.1